VSRDAARFLGGNRILEMTNENFARLLRGLTIAVGNRRNRILLYQFLAAEIRALHCSYGVGDGESYKRALTFLSPARARSGAFSLASGDELVSLGFRVGNPVGNWMASAEFSSIPVTRRHYPDNEQRIAFYRDKLLGSTAPIRWSARPPCGTRRAWRR
jgi:hypothetical protein